MGTQPLSLCLSPWAHFTSLPSIRFQLPSFSGWGLGFFFISRMLSADFSWLALGLTAADEHPETLVSSCCVQLPTQGGLGRFSCGLREIDYRRGLESDPASIVSIDDCIANLLASQELMHALRQNNSVPPNVTFYVDDLEDEWTYSYKFDFIYGRMLTGSIADWPRFIRQSFECVLPQMAGSSRG